MPPNPTPCASDLRPPRGGEPSPSPPCWPRLGGLLAGQGVYPPPGTCFQPSKPAKIDFVQLLASSGSSWELLKVPGSVWEHLESVLAASRTAVPVHRTAVRSHKTTVLASKIACPAHKTAVPGHKIIEIPMKKQHF